MVHGAGKRAPPGRLVPSVYGWIRVDAVHRIGRHGHWHWVLGGAHDGIHWRDQRTRHPGHTVHIRQLHDSPRTPAGVCARVYISVENNNASQLPSARDRRHHHIARKTVNFFNFNYFRKLLNKIIKLQPLGNTWRIINTYLKV